MKVKVMGIVIMVLMSLHAILGVYCMKLNGELELNKAELDLNYDNKCGQVIQRMHAQMWVCKDYSALLKGIADGEKSLEEFQLYVNAVGNFTNPEIIQGDFVLLNKNNDELIDGLMRIMSCVNLRSDMLEKASSAELSNLGEAFEELSKLLQDDAGEETILYYLRKDMQGEALHDIEKEERQSLIQRINVVLAKIEAYGN